ncbi:MGH1-like glycoside hydrolase domain-containing protein [Salinigranum halophilum]|uniref:MGH1-like glycoside hydrolase domain-containing protein n=1 Tax=Salinigranum halophilum TaxID=2565931 RepID=UPI0010A8E855|nr:trehalase family glycosidase [Salinigranum halophilum]
MTDHGDTEDADVPSRAERRAEAIDVLDANRRDGYTIPSSTLYPFQWNWDSAFIAIGLAGVDPDAAKAEVETLLSATWPNGMLPQIVFWADAEGYFPGPVEWDAGFDDVETSGISQPPVVATAARHVYEVTGDDDFRDRVLDPLDDHLSWWRRERSTDGVVYTRHPWETGMDDSPAWRGPLERFDPGPVEYERADRKSAELADQRPTDWDYDRYVALLQQGRAVGWDESALRDCCPFRVEDVLTNSVYVRACEDLAALYASAGDDAAAATWRDQAATTRAVMRDRLWSDELGLFVSYDRVADEPLLERTVAGLVPVLGGVPTTAQFERLSETLTAEFFDLAYAVPTYVGDDFDPDRYWRGPVWMNTNWLLERGLRRYDATDAADRVRADSLALLDREGFREYFNPRSGEGRGSDDFAWSAALYLEWTTA